MTNKAKEINNKVGEVMNEVTKKGSKRGVQIGYYTTDTGRVIALAEVQGNQKSYPVNPHAPATTVLKGLGITPGPTLWGSRR